MKKVVAILVLSISLIAVWFSHPAEAADLAGGAKVFSANCAACHVGGGNLVNATKTLKKADLEKYEMASLEAIKTQVTNGKNAMPAFSGRLTADQIEDVAAYVLDQAGKGW
ncbi:MAG: c-type cytochrome [Elainella sp. Prado103]|jgi:cytochrome c6|nr:c-type cytochrome [Elainella sp. Prado103]